MFWSETVYACAVSGCLFFVAPVPEIPPYEGGEGEDEIQADGGGIKFPILTVDAACAAFQRAGEEGGEQEAQGKLGQMVRCGFVFEGEDAQAALGQEREVGGEQGNQQQGIHGSGHIGAFVLVGKGFRLPSFKGKI